jgi:hypothetical protein
LFIPLTNSQRKIKKKITKRSNTNDYLYKICLLKKDKSIHFLKDGSRTVMSFKQTCLIHSSFLIVHNFKQSRDKVLNC